MTWCLNPQHYEDSRCVNYLWWAKEAKQTGERETKGVGAEDT